VNALMLRMPASPFSARSSDRSWVDDSDRVTCAACGVQFTLFNRRHHCRLCGEVVCATCSPHTLPQSAANSGEESWNQELPAAAMDLQGGEGADRELSSGEGAGCNGEEAATAEPVEQKPVEQKPVETPVKQAHQQTEQPAPAGQPLNGHTGVAMLILQAHRARELQDTQTFGSQDPYVVVSCGKETSRTFQCSSGDTSPEWEAEHENKLELDISLSCVQLPKSPLTPRPVGGLVTVEVWNQNTVEDNLIGTFEIDLAGTVCLLHTSKSNVMGSNSGC
jgi:hypothetical protein